MLSYCLPLVDIFFFFNDTATTEIYTLSLHDALPISFEHIDLEVEAVHRHDVAHLVDGAMRAVLGQQRLGIGQRDPVFEDRKSTRLNSSHSQISYAVFCLKKKKHRSTMCACSLVTHTY